jgi:hypothetical protein
MWIYSFLISLGVGYENIDIIDNYDQKETYFNKLFDYLHLYIHAS